MVIHGKCPSALGGHRGAKAIFGMLPLAVPGAPCFSHPVAIANFTSTSS